MDRRNLDRTRVHYPIKLAIGAGEESLEVDAELLDHSSEGARLIVEKPVKLGSLVRLLVGADQFSGAVRYCTLDQARGRYLIGVRLQ